MCRCDLFCTFTDIAIMTYRSKCVKIELTKLWERLFICYELYCGCSHGLSIQIIIFSDNCFMRMIICCFADKASASELFSTSYIFEFLHAQHLPLYKLYFLQLNCHCFLILRHCISCNCCFVCCFCSFSFRTSSL